VVGKGQDLARLQKIAGKHTRFVGNISRWELRTYYRGAYALLQPGVEDFGMAAAEALATGTPVIAYNLGGVREIVRSADYGILYDEPREEALAEAIRVFLQNPDRFRASVLQQQTLHFSEDRFRDALYMWVTRTLES